MSGEDLDEDVALDLVHRLATAVFQERRFLSALPLFSDQSRRDWAHEWVVGELEAGNEALSWSDADELVMSLHSMDTDHRLWDAYAADTLSLWQHLWERLPDALLGSGRIHLRRYRTPEEWRAAGATVTITVGALEPTGPPTFWIWFEEADSVLSIESING
jgi:hypothetical protein